jgi:predicted 3-demethylubiquinone-9 3-methyltransferase (glyoxalase superfamily)
MPKISPFLWFDTQALEAANHYVSIFPNSKITEIAYYGDGGPGPKGSVMVVGFELDGQEHLALNGGPHFKFSEAISLSVDCETQDQIDHYWEKLSAGGEKSSCGWLKDKFGLSWQVSPSMLRKMHRDPDPAKTKRVMAAMMSMKKIVIADLKKAYEG